MKNFKGIFPIIIGTFILSVGINIFLVPSKISTGGVTSVGTVLLYFFEIPMSFTNITINVLLFIAGYFVSGFKLLKNSILGIILLSLFLEITSYFPTYSENTLLCSVFGGVLAGAGIGLIIREGASTGGSDFVAIILTKYFPHISTATILLVIDAIIVIICGFVFKSITVTLYSIISLYVASCVADKILTIGSVAKQIKIITSNPGEISALILNKFHRGVTSFDSFGMYSGEKRTVLLCVVFPKELPHIIREVKRIDRKAFTIISDVREVFGEGFKTNM